MLEQKDCPICKNKGRYKYSDLYPQMVVSGYCPHCGQKPSLEYLRNLGFTEILECAKDGPVYRAFSSEEDLNNYEKEFQEKVSSIYE